jgi:hypothetical protein
MGKERCHKHCRVICIERNSNDGSPPTYFLEKATVRGQLKELLKGVDGEYKMERRERVSLSKPPSMLDR